MHQRSRSVALLACATAFAALISCTGGDGPPVPGAQQQPIVPPLDPALAQQPAASIPLDETFPPHATDKGDYRRSGVFAAKGLRQLTGVKWKLRTGGEVNTAAVFDGLVYAGSSDGALYAVDLANGVQRWKIKTRGTQFGKGVFSPPTVIGDAVYFWSQDRALRAADAKTGAERWKYQTDVLAGFFDTSPIVIGGAVITDTSNPYMVGVDAATGKKIWSFSGRNILVSGAAFSRGSVLVGDLDGFLNSVGATPVAQYPGYVNWRYDSGGLIGSGPAIAGDAAYFTGFNHQIHDTPKPPAKGKIVLHAVDLMNGAGRWRFETGPHEPSNTIASSSPAVAGGLVFFGGHDGVLYAVDAATGQARWTFPTGDMILSAPSVADGVVYFGSFDNHLYAVEAATGKLLWKFETKGAVDTAPVILDGMVVFGSRDKHLYALH